jgi:LysM repeat protein
VAASISTCLPAKPASGNMRAMRLDAILAGAIAFLPSFLSGQTPATSPAKASPETLQLQLLTKKIDEQNAKIDILSQQILKLEQQFSHARPGIMIGEAEPSRTKPTDSITPMPRPAGGSTHTVERGETLTSIGKLYGVSVSDLQRFNHIEDPLKLRAGQTIMIPPSPTPAAPSPGE